MGLLIVSIGISLFIANGVLQAVRKGLNIASVAVDVTQGCPNGAFTEFSGKLLCSNPAPYLYSVVTNDDTARLVFWAGGCLLGLVNFLIIFRTLRNPGEHFARQSLSFKKIGLLVTAMGAFLAIGGAGGSSGALTESYYDCRNVTQQKDGNWTGCVSQNLVFQGSPSGFWDIWVQFTVAVLEGIFAW